MAALFSKVKPEKTPLPTEDDAAMAREEELRRARRLQQARAATVQTETAVPTAAKKLTGS